MKIFKNSIKYTSFIACTLLLCTCLSVSVTANQQLSSKSTNMVENIRSEHISEKTTYSSGEILMKLKPVVSKYSSENILSEIQQITRKKTSFASIDSIVPVFSQESSMKYLEEKSISLNRWYTIQFNNKNIDVPQEVERYKNDPALSDFFEYIQPNYLMSPSIVPDDPYYSTSGSWGQSYPDLWGLQKIGMNGAWDVTTGSTDVIAAVIDTGVDYNHPDIAANMWINPDEIAGNGIDDDDDGFVDNIYGADFSDDDADPSDYYGHGTHCAGTIAAVGNNGIGVVGVNWQTKIMAVKIFPNAYSDVCAEAIKWAADNGADVLSNSWGPSDRVPTDPITEDAIRYAYSKGCIIVFASGNNNDDCVHYFPGSMDEVINVAAIDYQGQKAWFSNWGDKITVCAPGVNILSLRAEGTSMGTTIDNEYCVASGTSMACPHVAGLAALMRAHNPDLTPEMVKLILINTADVVESDVPIGSLINASKALHRKPALLSFNITDWADAHDIFTIIGTAQGELFESYTFSYGNGRNPSQWTEILTSTSPVSDGVLGYLNVTELSEGTYSLRLNLTCTDAMYTATQLFIVNNEYNSFVVDDDNPSADFIRIQDAIDAAGKDETIFICSGTYNESLLIDRPISITGESATETVINGGDHDVIIRIIADGIHISNITLEFGDHFEQIGMKILSNDNIITATRSNLQDDLSQTCFYLLFASRNILSQNIITGGYNGLLLEAGTQNIICNNILDGISHYGVNLKVSYEAKVFNNTLQGKAAGIGLYVQGLYVDTYKENIFADNICTNWQTGMYISEDSSSNIIKGNTLRNNSIGLALYSVSHSIIFDNTIIFNTYTGISLTSYYLSHCSNNKLIGNIISFNNNGINFGTTKIESNLFYGNTISNNTGRGVDCSGSGSSPRYNKFYHNNFMNNTLGHARDYNNYWDNGYPSGGNYWDNYTGIDLYHGPHQDIPGSDGIGDTAYTIYSLFTWDSYPLMTRCLSSLYAEVQGPSQGKTGEPIQFFGCAFSGQSPYTWSWDFGDGQISEKQNPSHIYNQTGWYTITLIVSDSIGTIVNNTITITITLPPLRADAHGPYIGNVDQLIQFYGDGRGGNPPYLYRWDFGDYTPSSDEQEPIHAYTESGTFTVTLTVTDSTGTTNSSSTTVTVINPLIADAHGPYFGVLNQSVYLTGSAVGGFPPYSYHWDFDDGQMSDLQNPVCTYHVLGTYTIILTVTDTTGTNAVNTSSITIVESFPIHNINQDMYYMSIQAAIDGANPGDTILVSQGVYHEQLLIEKSLTLIGEDQNNTIIDSNQEGYGVLIYANDVDISGFTIQHSGGEFQEAGLIICSWYSIIRDITIIHDFIGMEVSGEYNMIIRNTIELNSIGLVCMYFIHTSNNTISENIVRNSSWMGIVLEYGSSHNTIYQNNVTNTLLGITTQIGGKRTLSSHRILNKDGGGESYQSTNNTIYHNNFFNNTQNANDPFINLWYNITLQEGNFWEDFESNPGFPDVYMIPGGDNTDLYPLTAPYKHLPDLIIVNFTATPVLETLMNLTVTTMNNGGLDITTPFQISFYGYKEPINLRTYPTHFGTVEISSLSVGKTTNATIEVELKPEIQTILVIIDSASMIEESNETNNQKMISLPHYILWNSLTQTIAVFKNLNNQYKVPTTEKVLQITTDALSAEAYTNPEDYLKIMTTIASLEDEIGQELKGQIPADLHVQYQELVKQLLDRIIDSSEISWKDSTAIAEMQLELCNFISGALLAE